MKRIVILIDNAYSYAGTENICNFMAETFGADNEVTVYSLHGSGETFYPFDNVREIVTFRGKRFPLLSAIISINNKNFDFAFIISMGKLSVYFSLIQKMISITGKNKAKFISCEHVSYHSFSPLIKILKKTFLKFYDGVILLTSSDQAIYNSFNITSFCIPNPVQYQGVIRNTRSKIALAAGRLSHQKGFDKLINIWSAFIINNPDWKLYIAGDGELMLSLQSKVKELGIENSITFLGRVNNIEYYYNIADVFLMTSRYEGLPLVLLESQSWGMPAISFDCPTGPKEVIKNSENGFLINMDDNELFISKLELLNEDDVFYRLSQGAVSNSSMYNPELIKQKWNALLHHNFKE
ncbi:glycosyltransferase [Tatumella sp. JGM118]|uniref:glycosyltransferase n=1 Tax=Tatumella sp. JGM118 TaxID=2799796 RepID=UPI001BAEB8CD|nr:glycosyltransferase [Tatumella sp. JGM118]MBS0910037.1 glycosyltransferase [Tatumella sp. JGM118]